MTMSSAELAADLAEAEKLLSTAIRPNIRSLLGGFVNQTRQACKATSVDNAPTPTEMDVSDNVAEPAPAAAKAKLAALSKSTPTPAPPKPPVRPATQAPSTTGALVYKPIDSFGWDQDPHGTDPAFVYIFITSGVEGVGDAKERVSCDFNARSFDLKILDFNGANLRLFKNNLHDPIVPEASKFIVKKNSIKIKLQKVKGEYGNQTWNKLQKDKPIEDSKAQEDPRGGIMDILKNIYEDGDDKTKKLIGETMVKQQQERAAEGRSL